MKKIDNDEMNKFVDDFLKGNLTKVFKSQDEPKDNSGPIKIITGNSYKEITSDPMKEVFVNICAPTHKDCIEI